MTGNKITDLNVNLAGRKQKGRDMSQGLDQIERLLKCHTEMTDHELKRVMMLQVAINRLILGAEERLWNKASRVVSSRHDENTTTIEHSQPRTDYCL